MCYKVREITGRKVWCGFFKSNQIYTYIYTNIELKINI